MYKLATFAVLGLAAASAQFLDDRFLQTTTTGLTTSGAAACATDATKETSTVAGFCCAKWVRLVGTTSTPSAATASVLVPVDFHNQALTIGSPATTTYTFTCNFAASAVARTACTDNTACTTAGTCCANFTMSFGTTGATTLASKTASFCSDPTKNNGTLATVTGYVATVAPAAGTGVVAASTCTVTSAGSFIKAAFIVFAALVSVIIF
jgi:hypothetical protein